MTEILDAFGDDVKVDSSMSCLGDIMAGKTVNEIKRGLPEDNFYGKATHAKILSAVAEAPQALSDEKIKILERDILTEKLSEELYAVKEGVRDAIRFFYKDLNHAKHFGEGRVLSDAAQKKFDNLHVALLNRPF